MNEIEYLDDAKYAGDGYTTPGFYFWNECWVDCYGPYPTREAAEAELKRYCQEELGL